MTKRDKLIQRFRSRPKDFTWNELVAMLEGFGYSRAGIGKTGGSRVRFSHPDYPQINLHRPHPTPILKRYQVEQVEELLKGEGLI
ncbi:MAG: type II toxin-antitoxin system HicA family toxin [Deltaproteobacteria bacterium]|nr:type II toxin-antitoxin system HicA family toxin [Deltaproteobacteria bacterium]